MKKRKKKYVIRALISLIVVRLDIYFYRIATPVKGLLDAFAVIFLNNKEYIAYYKEIQGIAPAYSVFFKALHRSTPKKTFSVQKVQWGRNCPPGPHVAPRMEPMLAHKQAYDDSALN